MPRYYAVQFKADRYDNWHYICSGSPEAASDGKSSAIPDLYRTYGDAKKRAGGFDRRLEKGYRIVAYDKEDKIDKALNAAWNTGAAVAAPVVAAAYVAAAASVIVGFGIGSLIATPFWATETLIHKTLGRDREKCPNCGKKRGMPIQWTVPATTLANLHPIRHRECRYCGHRQTLASHESKVRKYGGN